MPTRYTLEQVIAIFESKKCVLLDSEYTNQLQKLNYIASCGHTHSVNLKSFLNDKCVKCRSCALEIPTFETIKKTFADKGCILDMTEEELNATYVNNRTKLNYIASCGHSNSVAWSNFISLNQGTNCLLCVKKNTGEKLKELRSGENNNSSIEQEFKCIQYFIELVKPYFQLKKTFDGCRADVALRPINNIEDSWLGIQVKTTCKKNHMGKYDFKLNKTKYENCIILCICLEDKKMWLIPYEDVQELSSIGVSIKSKYNCYEVSTDNIQNKLTNFYQCTAKFSFDTLNTPTSDTHKQEQYYRKQREEHLDFIEFVYPELEGTVYDFKIAEYKIQEKVGFICKDNDESFGFSLSKSNGRSKKDDQNNTDTDKPIKKGKKYNCSYKIGDNDFYWLHCKNTSIFYVIPESILIEKGYVGDKCKQHLYISPTNMNTKWVKEYLFNYDNLDKQRLLQLLHI
jgi:hypothetical protein